MPDGVSQARIRICAPVPDDAPALFAFELANRAFFEAMINARSATYYSLDAVRYAIEEAGKQRAQDLSYQYLIKSGDAILGRVNLNSVIRKYYNKADLGYRVCQSQGRKGIATRAVALLLTEAFDSLGFWRIEAQARVDNLGSLRVLEKNNFSQFGCVQQGMCLNHVWHDVLHFECRSPNGPRLE